MKKFTWLPIAVAGLCAGAVTGLLGAGGGMILVPLLTKWGGLEEDQVFPASVSIILPICIISLLFQGRSSAITFADVLPYLLGSGIGGIAVGFWGRKIPVKWLHRILGALILWGGIRYLC